MEDVSIANEWIFPSYKQHHCCGGCWTGCVPVAWAQVFAYFDRLAHYSPHWKNKCRNCQNLWRCSDGGPECVAPSTFTEPVEEFVEDLRHVLKTHCKYGQGGTSWRHYNLVESWLKERVGESATVSKYPDVLVSGSLERSRRTTIYGYEGDTLQRAIDAIRAGYPAVISIKVLDHRYEKLPGHAVVATKYRGGSYKTYRTCFRGICGNWKTQWQHKFYLHFGWSARSVNGDGWYRALARGVCVARPW